MIVRKATKEDMLEKSLKDLKDVAKAIGIDLKDDKEEMIKDLLKEGVLICQDM